MSPLKACPSPGWEEPQGSRDVRLSAASLTESEPGGLPAGATIPLQGCSGPSPAQSLTASESAPDQAGPGIPDPANLTSPVESSLVSSTAASIPHQASTAHQPAPDHQAPVADTGGDPSARKVLSTAASAPVDQTLPVSVAVIPTPLPELSVGPEPTAATGTATGMPEQLSGEMSNGMEHYQRLRRRLLISTLVATAAAAPLTWLLFDLPAAGSLLAGALAGLLYLVLLARSVARLGGDRRSVGKVQLLVPVVLVLTSSRLPQLELVPALVGFLLYKPALLVQAYLDR